MKIDLILLLFIVYIVYALYCSLAVFYRPGDRGEIFSSLRIPLVVFIYFLTPCGALYLAYQAFWLVWPELFWVFVLLVLPLSLFIIIYFSTDPQWPIGKALGINFERLSRGTMQTLLSLNFAISVMVILIVGTRALSRVLPTISPALHGIGKTLSLLADLIGIVGGIMGF